MWRNRVNSRQSNELIDGVMAGAVDISRHIDERFGPVPPVPAVQPPFERDIERLAPILNRLIARIDYNHNGTISMTELNAALRDPSLSREEAVLAAMLKKYFDKITPLSNDGYFSGSEISRQDINQFITMWQNRVNSGRSNELIDGVMASVVDNGLSLDRANMSLYANRDNPLASIVPDACVQPVGVDNDTFVAAMASLAAVNPQAIFNMIKDNGNGSYDVTFPGQTPIRVEAPTAGELAYYGVGSENGTWAAILQMAYGRYWSPTAQMPLEGAGSSIFDNGLRILTGLGADTDDNKWTRYDTLNTWLDRSINGTPRRPVTAQINHWFANIGGSAAPGLVVNHPYAVIGYTPNANDLTQAIITLRNPTGNNFWPSGGPPQGVEILSNGNFRMNLATFNRLFSGPTYAR
jgi:hypothetical protein